MGEHIARQENVHARELDSTEVRAISSELNDKVRVEVDAAARSRICRQ